MKTLHTEGLKAAQGVFVRVASIILLITAVAKVSVLFSDSRMLDRRDPVTEFLNVRQVMIFAGLVEFLVVGLLWTRAATLFTKLTALFSLSVAFLGYRTTRHILGVITPCNCMGLLPDWVPLLSPKVVDKTSMAISILLFVGSISFLVCQWLAERAWPRNRPSPVAEVSCVR